MTYVLFISAFYAEYAKPSNEFFSKKHKIPSSAPPCHHPSKFFSVVRHLTLLLSSPISFSHSFIFQWKLFTGILNVTRQLQFQTHVAFSSFSPQSLIIASYQPKRNFILMSLINHHYLILLSILKIYFLQFLPCVILS